MKSFFTPAAIVGLAFSHWTVANSTTELETVQVTATRTEQTISASLAPVSVFSKQDIERLQAKDLTELLSHAPGVTFSTSGSKGSDSSLYLRGTAYDHTLFLIDGQRFNSATLGGTNFQLIDPEQIERIEIVRGPRSSLYGSDAIGGVIQIFTKRGNETPSHYIRTGVGSHNAWQLAAGSQGKLTELRYAINVSYQETEGYDSFVDTTPPNNDDDGYRSTSESANLGYDFGDGGAVDLSYFYTQSKAEYDDIFLPPTTKPYAENWIQLTTLALQTPALGPWKNKLVLAETVDDSDVFNDLNAADRSHFRTTRDALSWQNDFNFNEQHQLSLGYEFYDDKVKSSTLYTDQNGRPVNSRYNQALFAIYQLDLSLTDLQLGLREDDNEDFDSHTTANAAIGFALGEQHKIILSYGEGFKVPTFNDLYWPITPWSYGNPNLKSESSEHYEIEFRSYYDIFSWNLNLYRSRISNLIDWAPVDPADIWGAWTPSNVASAKIRGAELAGQLDIDQWSIAATINYLDGEDEATGNQLANRPKKNLTVDIDRQLGDWQLGLSWQVVGKRYADQANSEKVGGYGVINARLGYQINEQLKAQLKLNNILDHNYQTRLGYNEDDFNAFVTLTYSL